ncbi:MAG: calcium-binding protein, partial [Solirubrobacteraceae bacterium]
MAGPSPQRTIRIRDAAKGQPNGTSANPRLSPDGRYIAFDSSASNLVASDRNGRGTDVFLYEQETGSLRLLSQGLAGAGANGPSTQPVVASGGATVAFASKAHNLVRGDASTFSGVFVWSRGGAGAPLSDAGVSRVSVTSAGVPANGDSTLPDLSDDGRKVVFASRASNLAPGNTQSHLNVFVHDLASGATTLVSAAPDGTPGNGDSTAPAISPEGRYVSFATSATNLVRGVATKGSSVVVRELATGSTQLASLSSAGQPQNASVRAPFMQVSDISSQGRYVAFDSDATNLVPRDGNRHTDVFVRDMVSKTTTRASLAATGQESSGGDSFAPSITADGHFVSFESLAGNLAPFEPAGANVFVHDLVRRTT